MGGCAAQEKHQEKIIDGIDRTNPYVSKLRQTPDTKSRQRLKTT